MKLFGADTLFRRLLVLLFMIVVASHLSILLVLVVHAALTGTFLPSYMPPGPPPELVPGWSPSPGPPPPGGPGPVPAAALWVIGGLNFLLIGAAAWFGAKSFMAPMRRLSQAAQRLGEHLDSPPIEVDGPEEVKEAARIFNQMQDRIRVQVAQRAEFLAAVSHDLRTPLTRIRLRVERIADQDAKNKLGFDVAEMAVMLDAALDFLRGEADTEAWQMLDVQALVESMEEDAAEIGQPVTMAGTARPLRAQPRSLRRCLGNLIDNALRYGQVARVILRDEPHCLVIEIEDEGPGIPADRLEAVLEPFVRLDSARSEHSGGFGLGLAIARDTALRHGGQLALRNRPERGLVARLTLPRKA